MPTAEARQRITAVHLVPVGAVERAAAESLASRVSRRIALPCRLDASPLEGGLRLLPGREQADADYLLRCLEQRSAGPGTAIIGITDADLGLRILTHVFGGAREGGCTAVVSRTRLRQEFYGLPADEELTARRVVAEVLHELGHLAGLAHCARYDCVMHFSPDVEAVDLRGLSYCAACAVGLPPGLHQRPTGAGT